MSKYRLNVLAPLLIPLIEDLPEFPTLLARVGALEDAPPGSSAWGDIAGDLEDQTDLQTALDAKQAADADLTTWAGLSPSANAQSLVTAASYAAMKALLDLEIGTDVQAYDADLTTWAGLTPSANHQTLVTQTFAQMRGSLDLEDGTDFLSPAAIAAAYQPLDSDLTTVAGLTATTDNFIQAKSSAWASRTVAQVKTDLELTGTNSGDQTTIAGITGTKAQFDTAVTDGDFLYVGDITQGLLHAQVMSRACIGF